MRLFFNFLLFYFLCLQNSVAAPISFIIENNVIKTNGNVVGRIEFDKLEVKEENIKAKKYLVKIYNSESQLIAVYNVRSNSKKAKKHTSSIYEASLNTIKDNVTHTGSNFLNFHEKEKTEEAIPQIKKVINYLCDRNYL